LWRALRERGFRGCRGVVSEWSARRKRADKADAGAIGRAPSARTVARLLTVGRDQLSKAQTITVAAIERGVAALAEARDILAEFQGIIRRKALPELDAWLDRAARSLVAAFANGVVKDRDAVQAAITSAWSNGQTEGQICKLERFPSRLNRRGIPESGLI